VLSIAFEASASLKHSRAFGGSRDFVDSGDFPSSESFPETNGFNGSLSPGRTGLYPPSSAVVLTVDIASSAPLEGSAAFAMSRAFDATEAFPSSGYFLTTYGFNQSTAPEPTATYAPSNAVIVTAAINRSSRGWTFALSPSIGFLLFSAWSSSKLFEVSEIFLPSPSVVATIIFRASDQFIQTERFLASRIFVVTPPFSSSHQFVPSLKLSPSRIFSKSAAFVTVDPCIGGGVGGGDNCGGVGGHQESRRIGAVVGGAVGGVLAVLAICGLLLLLFLRRHKREETSLFDGEVADAETTTTLDEPMDYISEYGLSDEAEMSDLDEECDLDLPHSAPINAYEGDSALATEHNPDDLAFGSSPAEAF
jgi:hypothetical protein